MTVRRASRIAPPAAGAGKGERGSQGRAPASRSVFTRRENLLTGTGTGLSGAEAHELAVSLDPSLILVASGITPDPWQENFLRSRAPRRLVMVHRQGGKSTVSAALAAWVLVFEAPADVLILSRSLPQAEETHRKTVSLLRAFAPHVGILSESTRSLRTEMGSRCFTVPGTDDAVRSFSAPRLVILDEASRIPDSAYLAVRPLFVTAPDGRLVCITTPKFREGWFYEEWTAGGAEWERFELPATKNPRISPEFLAREREKNEEAFRMDYLLEFGESASDRRNPKLVSAKALSNLDAAFGGAP